MPHLPRSFVVEDARLHRRCPEHVEVVYFPKQVLHVLQIGTPCLVLLGQKIFDDVAESFDPDAQGVLFRADFVLTVYFD